MYLHILGVNPGVVGALMHPSCSQFCLLAAQRRPPSQSFGGRKRRDKAKMPSPFPLPSDGRGWPSGRVKVIAGRGRPSAQIFKEQARERRRQGILPRFSGTSTFIFHLTFRGILTTDFADFTDPGEENR
jgi:hypothetical protein